MVAEVLLAVLIVAIISVVALGAGLFILFLVVLSPLGAVFRRVKKRGGT